MGFAALLATALAAVAPAAEQPAVLVLTRTEGFHHASIPAGVTAVEALGSGLGLRVDVTTSPARFTADGLARYRAVVFLNTTGDVLGPGQQSALRRFVERGGGFAGIHAAADTEHGWPWYATLLGARFAGHPPVQPARLRVATPRHSSTRGVPDPWQRTDEWYAFSRVPRARILLRLDERSYEAGETSMGANHPAAWCHAVGQGRSWYTAGGHTRESYAEPAFRAHLRGGLRYAAGLVGFRAC